VAPHYGLRTDRYTLAHFYRTNQWELFDLKKDPQQLRSVYDDATYAKTVTDLKAELTRLRTEFKDDSDAGRIPKGATAPARRRNQNQ